MLVHLFFESITTVDKDGKVLARLQNDRGSLRYGLFRLFVEELSACELVAGMDETEPPCRSPRR